MNKKRRLEIVQLVNKAILYYLEEALEGGETIFKEVIEELDGDADHIAYREIISALIFGFKESIND